MKSSTSSRNHNRRAGAAPATEVALVFDMDGTILDGRAAVIDAVQEGLAATYRHFRLPIPDPDRERIAAAIGLPNPTFYRAACKPATVPGDLFDRFIGEFEVRSTRAEIAALARGASHLYAGTEEALAALASRGHPMALFSNANELYFAAVVEAHRLDRFFREHLSLELAIRRRVARDKVGMVKYLGRGCHQTVVIGDRVHDIEAGRRSGARTVGCLYGFGEPQEFRDADWTIHHFPQILELPLAAPEAEVENPGRRQKGQA
jgi:phosphoglycolate phosphatase-like HAD superfamily hydrolase